MRFFKNLYIFLLLFACVAAHGGVRPSAVYVAANANDEKSLELASYYCRVRGVPAANIIKLDLPKHNGIVSRNVYLEKIEGPLFSELIRLGAIQASDFGIKDSLGRPDLFLTKFDVDFLVICKGVPWGVRSSKKEKANSSKTESSSLDSEISARFLRQKSFGGFVKNPAFSSTGDSWKAYGLVRTARIDGPSYEAARRVISSALNAERRGLRGRVYVDKSRFSPLGDKWFDALAGILKLQGFDVSVESSKRLLGFADRMDACAVYFGWYSRKPCGWFSMPAFMCADGMMGWHIYSFSALNLADPNSWSAALIEKNAASTDGNVFEPFLALTRNAQMFVKLVFEDKMLPAEAAFASLPALSWQNIYIGDPLYNPLAVGLDAQIAEIDAGQIDGLSQYSLIRKANLIAASAGNEAAAQFLSKYEGRVSDNALLWRKAELLQDPNFRVSAARQLLSRRIYTDIGYLGLAFELAAFLEKYGDGQSTIDLCLYCVKNYGDNGEFLSFVVDRAKKTSQKFNLQLPEEIGELADEMARKRAGGSANRALRN